MTALRDLLASIGVMCIAFTIVAIITVSIQDWRYRRARRIFDAHVEQARRVAAKDRHPSSRPLREDEIMRREISEAKARYVADELMP